MTFQLTPGSEAPAEMNIHFPETKALCAADNVARSMHNILTPRGALVRDPRVWASYLDEAIELFAADSEVLFSGHHWPCWGGERIAELLEKQRDLYAYLHDQTLRLLNKGYTGPEIAELVELPPSLAEEWHCREFYGSVSHNVKAIYQRYMGWFDGNPASLWQHPPREAARRYVEAIGGLDAVLEQGREALAAGDLRWAAELLNHAVFADPESEAAHELQAEALERLAFGAENATWRNFFLTGAKELREGFGGTATPAAPRDIVANLSVAQLLDAMAIRLDGPRAAEAELRIDWAISDPDEAHALTVRNGVLRHRAGRHEPAAEATLAIDRAALTELLLKTADVAELATSGRLRVEGDGERIGELLGLLDEPDPRFPIVTPRPPSFAFDANLSAPAAGTSPRRRSTRSSPRRARPSGSAGARSHVMRRRVPALGVVAAADPAAALAHPQVDPGHSKPQAFLTPLDLGRRVEVLDRVDVGAGRHSDDPRSWPREPASLRHSSIMTKSYTFVNHASHFSPYGGSMEAMARQSWTDDRIDERFDRVEGQISDFRIETRTEIKELRGEIKAQGDELRGGIQEQGSELRDEIKAQGDELRGGIQAQGGELRDEIKAQGDELRGGIQAQGSELRDEIKAQGDELRAGIKEQGDELRAGIKEQGDELRAGIKEQGSELRAEIAAGSAGLRQEIAGVEARIRSQANEHGRGLAKVLQGLRRIRKHARELPTDAPRDDRAAPHAQPGWLVRRFALVAAMVSLLITYL